MNDVVGVGVMADVRHGLFFGDLIAVDRFPVIFH